jgi:hypothetical protein
MTIQEQYTDTVRQTQESWANLVQPLTDGVSKAFAPPLFSAVDPNAAIDQVFDFWTKAVDLQREVAKQLVGTTVAAVERVRSQAESFTTAEHDQA